MKKMILFVILFSFMKFKINAQDSLTLNSLIQDTAHTLLIDVRTPEEFSSLHAQNSINIDSRTLSEQMNFFKKNKPKNFIIYCHSGKRSAYAVKILKQHGFSNVYDAHTVNHVIAIQQQK